VINDKVGFDGELQAPPAAQPLAEQQERLARFAAG
jgi:hypothetical protein